MMRWSAWLLEHKRIVVGFWLVLLVGAVLAVPSVGKRLSQQFALPGEPAYVTNQRIVDIYGTGGSQLPLVAVIRPPTGERVFSPAARRELAKAFANIAAHGRFRVVSYPSTGDPRFVVAGGRTTFALLFPSPQPLLGGPDLGPSTTRALARELPPGWTVQITGLDELELGGHTGGPAVLAETLLGGLGALVILAFVFGSLLAFVPLLIAAVSILTTFLLIYGLTEFTSVNTFVQYLVALIGLGVAIDYSLLLVTRWREELTQGRSSHDAVRYAMSTAGRSVAYSGLIVAVGLLSMVVLPVPFLRSMGYGGMLIPLVSAAAVLTLLPVLLATTGQRLDWPHLRSGNTIGRGWSRWTRGLVRWRWIAVAGALAILVPLVIAAFGLQIGTPRSAALAKSGPAYQGLVLLRQAGVPTGVLTPIEVLVPAVRNPELVAARLSTVPGVRDAVAPVGTMWRRDGTGLVDVLPVAETGTPAGKAAIARVRQAADALTGVGVGGRGAQDVDFTHALYGHLPLMIVVLVVVSLLLLMRAFQSVLLAVKGVLLNLVSIAAAFGVVVLVWQDGHGSNAYGVPAAGAVEIYVPILIFAFLYGLSMDYEVFVVSRICEAHQRTGSTRQAVVEGLGRTGRLVTSAALVLLFAFISLASGPIVTIKVIATGLGAGILLDATVIRALLLPALIILFGRWNWWMPRWAARSLGVRPAAVLPSRGSAAAVPPSSTTRE